MHIKPHINCRKRDHMKIRTDLAAEAVTSAGDINIGGVSSQTVVNEQAAVEISRIYVYTEQASKALGKPIGRYITVRMTDASRYECSAKA